MEMEIKKAPTNRHAACSKCKLAEHDSILLSNRINIRYFDDFFLLVSQ